MSEETPISRADADIMALRYLRDNGPHTMGPIDDESAFAAALVFLDLKKAGLATSACMTPGYVQWSITDAGRKAAA